MSLPSFGMRSHYYFIFTFLKPDNSDTTVQSVTNLTVFSFDHHNDSNFGACGGSELPMSITCRTDLLTLHEPNAPSRDNFCLFWVLAMALNKNLMWASETNVHRNKTTKQRIPIPDYDSLRPEMLRIKAEWETFIGTATGVSQFEQAERLFGCNINCYNLTEQPTARRKQRGVKISPCYTSCMVHKNTANIAVYQGHAMMIHNLPHLLDTEVLTCTICNKLFKSKKGALRHKAKTHGEDIQATPGPTAKFEPKKKFVGGVYERRLVYTDLSFLTVHNYRFVE